jgi:hypothetical protein
LSFTRSGFAGCSSASFGGAPNSSYASNFTFPTVPNAGYFCGGGDGTNNLASIDKVDYANDTATASVRSALSGARFGLAATGNSNFGYFIAGSFLSTVDRIEYSSDTQSASLRTPILSASSPSIAAVGNNNFGYAQVSGSNINRINYFNDTVTNQGNLLNFSGAGWSSTNNRNFGYFTGGYSAPITYSGLDRIDFSNDTLVASKRSNVVSTNYGMSGFGNETFGYFGGGINFSLVRRVDYANDTSTVSIRGPLSTSVNYLASATGSQQFGYFGGGQSPGVPRKSQVDRINYSNDTAIASVRGPLPVAKSSGAATSPLGYGGAPIYFTNPLPTVLQNQITFNDSNTLDLPFKRVLGSYGYWTGGIPAPADGQTSIVNRVDYSNDTSISSRRGNVAPNKRMFSTSSANYLYSAFHRSASLCRLDFSNDTADGIARGILAASGYVNSTLSNLNFAYFQGGEIFGSNVYRLDFSNDLSIGAARGKIPNNFYADSANTVGNLNYGYFNCSATVSRLNYSNDLSIALTRGNAIVSRAYTNAGVSNNNFGYFTTGLGTNSSRVERIDYSNDLSTSIYRGNMLYSNVYASAGTGNQNFGYFGGGLGVPTNQEVQKIDYSNDTSNASLRGYLSTKMGYHNATTNARSS